MRKTLILLFSSLCALNILAGVFPPSAGPGKTIEAVLAGPRSTTGTVQQWHMFESIPIHRDFEMRIVARDAAGGEQRFGPELPGLKAVEIQRRTRSYYTFMRIFDSEPGLRDAYVRKVAAALRERDPELVEFSVHIDLHYIRHLFHIRKDGKLTKRVPNVFGPFPIPTDDARSR